MGLELLEQFEFVCVGVEIQFVGIEWEQNFWWFLKQTGEDD